MPDLILDAGRFQEWYKPGKSLREFHASKARTRVIIGGRGSGKTTSIAVEATGHCFHNAGARVYALRKTEESNIDTTLETFEQVFANLGSAYVETDISLFRKYRSGSRYRLPSRRAILMYEHFLQTNPTKGEIKSWIEGIGTRYCSHLLFSGVPSVQYRASRFRGFECSMMVFVEADQFEEEDLDLAIACLRWKGADAEICDDRGFIKDTCIILDTNPPGTDHWIAQMEEEAFRNKDTTIHFWHIHTDENKENLPPGYVEHLKKQYARKPAMYSRMVEGKYADAFDGDPVLWGFQIEHAYEHLHFPKNAYLVRGWDFGTTHAVIWSAYWLENNMEYWWDLYEYFATHSDVDRQCEKALEITNVVFPFWNDRFLCSGVLDFCDAAGDQKKDTGKSIDVLNTYRIYPGFSRMNMATSLAVYNRLLQKTDLKGRLTYRIDRKACPMLYTASLGGYRYPVRGEPGFNSGKPLKGEAGGNYDHIADAARYAKMNCLKLIRQELAVDKKPSIGKLRRKRSFNRKRDWWGINKLLRR
jgi:hypothetical protein